MRNHFSSTSGPKSFKSAIKAEDREDARHVPKVPLGIGAIILESNLAVWDENLKNT